VKLKCGVHADRESETRPIFVCHHCGMPVCEEHGWVVSADDAFDASEEPVSRSAMHCPECAGYHPRGANKRRGWGIIRSRAVAGQEAPATGQPPGYGPEAPRPPGPYPQQSAYPQPQTPYPPQPQPQPYQQPYQPQPYPQQTYPEQPYPQQQPPPQPQPPAPHRPPRAPGPARDGSW
jgi:hypothetical protein